MTFHSKRRSACRTSAWRDKSNGPLFNSVFNCEFDSFRIWRAEEGPKPAPLLEKTKATGDRHTPAIYATDFSTTDPKWLIYPGDDETDVAIQDGRLRLKYKQKWRLWSGDDLPWVESADLEIIGRSPTGSWGFAVLDDEDPRTGLMIGLKSTGKVAAWRIEVISPGAGDGHNKLTPVPLPGEPTASKWNPDGAFNTLRATVREGVIDLWVNGELVCEKIKISVPMQRMHIELAGMTLVEPVDCEFDSLKIWRAGEGPPIAAEPTRADNGFMVSDSTRKRALVFCWKYRPTGIH